jgi:hypothetical protein
MYYLSMWIIMAWQRISPDVTAKGFIQCCISNALDGTDYYMLWNSSEEDGNVRSVRTMKAQTVKMETVTLIDKGRWTLTCFVH